MANMDPALSCQFGVLIGVTKAMTIPNGAAPGDVLELTVGEAAHGGWCVARSGAPGDQGKVVFVRHALPGERVRARVTSRTTRFARAEAIEILQASPDRVEPPCPYARPDGCGGCDLQHARPATQRAMKAQVIRQQLRRMAGIEREVTVEALPGDPAGLGWRTRVGFAVGPDGTAGLRKHRSREVVAIADCLIAHPLVRAGDVTGRRWPGARGVEVTVSPGSGERSVAVSGPVRSGGGNPRPWLTQHAAGRTWRVGAGVFWQVHPAAASVLTEVVLAALRPQPGDVALDLYCGAGLFTGALAGAVGAAGLVTGVESDVAAVRDARKNLARFPQVRVHRGDAAQVLAERGLGGASLAVLDPPRAGVDRRVIEMLAPALRRIAYVSCDPATLARDLAVFAGLGWRVDDLRAFDAFPMTHHVECVATLTTGPGG
jgi:tRNA/tmRNA/rRNA uracil-C5-methylase (TrmA/RlmC/RlmD family)